MITLQKAYNEYLENHCEGAVFEPSLSQDGRLCWRIPRQKVEHIYDWMGKYLGKQVLQYSEWVWLGKKGAIKVTNSPSYTAKAVDNSKLTLDMKRWVWKTYFGVDL